MHLGEHDIKRWLPISKRPDVWTWSRTSRDFFDLRMTALRLKDGSLLVVSPVPNPGEEAFQELEALGPVTVLCAPNHYHNLGIKPFLERFPKARCVASPQAIPRLQKMTGIPFEPWTQIQEHLPDGITLTEPEGLKAGELWLEVSGHQPDGNILIVCDAFFNMHDSKSMLWSLIFRLGGSMPGLKVSRVFRLIGMSDRKRYKTWVTHRWQSFEPELLVPAHGDFYASSALSEELLELI